MNTRDLLDDLAAAETAGLEVDLAAVRREVARRAGHDHSEKAVRSRRLFGVIMAAAAVVAVLVVLLPGGPVRRASVPAGPVPGGLPSTWHPAPEWTPPITRHPMKAAVMVLGTPLETGSRTDRRRFASAPVLLSADGRTYASLPGWKDDDGGVALSGDGTRVAWWTASRAGDELAAPTLPTLPLEVHLLRTADPDVRTVTLPVALPNSMVWTGNDLVVTGRVRDPGSLPNGLAPRTWRIDGRTGAMRELCACAETVLGVAPAGWVLRPWTGASNLATSIDFVEQHAPGTRPVSAADFGSSQAPADLRGFLSPRLKAYPISSAGVSGTLESWSGGQPVDFASADVVHGAWVGGRSQWAVVADGFMTRDQSSVRGAPASRRFWSIPSLADEPVLSATVVDWVSGGILVRVDTRSGSTLRLLDPRTRAVRVLSRGSTITRPVAAATVLVGDARPHPVPAPDRPLTDRSHLVFLAARNVDVLIGVGVALALAIAMPVHRRLLRRRDRHPGPVSAGE